MTIYDLKPAFQNLLRPLCRRLAQKGVTANQVTVSAAGLSLFAGGLVWASDGHRCALGLIPGVLLLRMALNAIDGMLAREHGMKSPLGAILNELGDVVSDAALYLPLASVPGMPAGLVTGMVILAIFTEMTGVVACQIGSARRYDGPMGKSDRAACMGILALLLALGVPAGPWLRWVFGIVIMLLVMTIANRGKRALAEIKS